MTVNSPMPGSDLDPNFIERERNRLAGRALAFLIGLNGVAALVLLTIVAMEPQATVDRKVTMAMLVFSGGALAALFSSFLAYVNRTVRLESPSRRGLRRALRTIAIIAVVGSGAALSDRHEYGGDNPGRKIQLPSEEPAGGQTAQAAANQECSPAGGLRSALERARVGC